MEELREFIGNCPVSVRKSAKYHIRSEKGNYVVGINYETPEGDEWTPTSKAHPKLVEMVNNVKKQILKTGGGAFYINEYHQVIVPVNGKYYLAGEYNDELKFKLADEYEDAEVSARATDLNGNPLNIGDEWIGSMMGIPYVIAAGASDIRFEVKLSPCRTRKMRLSRYVGEEAAKDLAKRLCRVIGHELGGRFYINEMREMFKPISEDNIYTHYIYLGRLDDDAPWFPKEITI